MSILAMALIVLGIATTILFAAANSIFRRAFLRTDRAADYLDNLPPEYAGRMRYGREWLADPRRNLEPVTIQSHDELTLSANILHNADDKRFIALVHCYHSTSMRDFGSAAKYYYRMGYSLLLIDLRAHGASGGKVITFGLNERKDIARWVRMLSERFGPDIRVFLNGLSLGAATVTMAAGSGLPPCVKGIIADCGFTSPIAIVRHIMRRDYHLRFPPMIWALNAIFYLRTGMGLWDYSTTVAMKENRIPMLFIHGGADDFVPTSMSIESCEACAGPKELYIVPGAAHAVSYLRDARGYMDRVSRFLSRYEGGPAGAESSNVN